MIYRLLMIVLVLMLVGAAAAQEEATYAVATHYPEFGGTLPAPFEIERVSYTDYNHRETDYLAVDAATADAVMAEIEAETGLSVSLLNDWADVEENSDALQIINNVPIEGALYTIILPPGWTRDANMPVVLSGNGAGKSNNVRLYEDAEITLPQVIAASGGSGLIGAMSNVGGTESQGVDEKTYRSVGAFFDFIDENGGDKMNAVTAGGSRGGVSALMWGINPLGLDYNVHTILAEVPPTYLGTFSQVSPLTYPSMARIATLISRDDNAWRYDNDGATPGMNPSPFLEILFNTGDPDEADALSPAGLAEKLVGKQVVISAGAHDAFFQLAPFLQFDRLLTELDVKHATFVTLASGHELSDFWIDTTTLYLLSLSRGVNLPLLTGRYYFIDTDPRSDAEMSLTDFFRQRGIAAAARELPVTAEFPYRAGVGNPIDVAVCGTPGDVVSIAAASAAGDMLYSADFTLDENECYVERVTVDVPPGDYLWSLTVNGENINPRNTPTRGADGCGILAVTFVSEDQPEPATTYAFNRDMAFGLDEYSGQPDYCG